MPLRKALIQCALIVVLLSGCVHSNPVPMSQVILPEVPPKLEECFRRAFPDIPDRALSKRDVVKIISEAKVLNRVKTACGEQAVAWINGVKQSYGGEQDNAR